MPFPRRSLLAALVLACALAIASTGTALAAAPSDNRVLLVFLPQDQTVSPTGRAQPSVLDELAGHPQLALGMSSATQSGYSPEQALLDMSAGTRTSLGTYHPKKPPELTLVPSDPNGPATLDGWATVVKRARSAPADIFPGILAGSIPGGAGYAGVSKEQNLEAIVATTRHGGIAAASLGSATTVAARAQNLLQAHRLVVASLTPNQTGDAQLGQLIANRQPGELLIAMQTPPPLTGPQLLWTGIAGAGPPGGITSETTHVPGIVAGIDLVPTILDHLGIHVHKGVKGEKMVVSGSRDPAGLQKLYSRLGVIGARRTPALETFMFAWLGVVLLAGILRDRRGVRYAFRLGGLALMWIPTMLLVTAAVQPSRQLELFMLAGGAFALAALTDRFVRWPRGPAVPAITGLVLYAADLANHSHFIIRSLLGPSPRSGSRFYGLGNELEISLTLLLLVAVAATLRNRERSRNACLAYGLGGVALAVVVGSGRLGADVGGIFTIAGGAAVATLLMLPGGITKRSLGIAILTPIVGLAALAALDLATGGNGHFTRTVLDGSFGDLVDTVKRRYEVAWSIVRGGDAPLLTILSILAVIYAIKHRARVYAALGGDPVWRAALIGGLAAAISGSLFNDSGVVMLFIGVVALACVTAYLRGRPDPAAR